MAANLARHAMVAAMLNICLSTTLRADDGWGDLTGTVVLHGAPPAVQKLELGTDSYCCQAAPQNESLILGEKQQIANVVIYVRPHRDKPIAIHPDYAVTHAEPVEFDNKQCAFTPHVVLVRTGQTLLIKNSDAVNHNVNGELGDEAFNFMLSASGAQELTFDMPQRLPRPVACNLHPFMRGWLLVRDDPYMTTTDEEGRFEIAKLPAGEHEIQFWHERPGYLQHCRSEHAEFDRRGRLIVTIEADTTTDLGTIVVDAELMASEGG